MAAASEKKRILSPRFALPLSAVATLVILFAAYYFVIIKRQQAALDDRASRSLAAVSMQFGDVISTYATAFRAAAKDVSEAPVIERSKHAAVPATLNAVRGLKSELPTQFLPLLTAKRAKLSDIHRCTTPAAGEDPIAAQPEQNVSLRVVVTSDGYAMEMRSYNWCALLPIDRTVLPLINTGTADIFDEVLIADSSGTVLYQTMHSGVLAQSLDFVRPETGKQANTSGADTATGNNRSNNSVSNVLPTTVAGADYRAYLVPVRLPVVGSAASKNAGGPFQLCGLILQEHFGRKSRSVPLTMLVAISLAIILVTVGAWPFLKFRTIRRTEQITRFAGLYYSLSIAFTVMFIVLLLIHVNYGFSDPKTDNNMEDLAKAINENVGLELRDILIAMKSVAGNLKPADMAPHAPEPVCNDVPDRRKLQQTQPNLLSSVHMEVSAYPYFRRLFVYDSQGYEQLKWTIDETLPAPLRVCDRPYFQGVERNDLWYLSDKEFSGTRFRVDPIYSKSTGEYVAAIAIPYPIKTGPESADAGVMMMATPMMSLINPVLPPDFGFAVIDPTGAVLFHSDTSRALRENLFDELADSRAFRAAVLARRADWRRERYEGQDYRMYVTPFRSVQNCPWSLVIFSNRAALGDKALDRILLTILLCTLYFMFLVIVAVLLRQRLQCHLWASPLPQNHTLYWHLTIVLAFVGVLSYSIFFQLSPQWLMCAVIVIPVSALVFSILTLYNHRASITLVAGTVAGLALVLRLSLIGSSVAPREKSATLTIALIAAAYFTLGLESLTIALENLLPSSTTGEFSSSTTTSGTVQECIHTKPFATAYTTAALVLLIVVCAIPCIGFFKLSYDYDEILATKRRQLLTLTALSDRENRILGDYLGVTISQEKAAYANDLRKWLFLRRRLQTASLDLYDKTFRSRTAGEIIVPRPNDPWPVWWTDMVTRWIPRHADSLTPLISENCTKDSNWQWSISAANRLRLHSVNMPDQASIDCNADSDKYMSYATRASEIQSLRKLASANPTFLVQDLTYDFDELRPWGMAPLPLLSVIGILVGLFFSMRSTISRMFLLTWQSRDALKELAHQDPWNAKAWDPKSLEQAIKDRENCILVGLPSMGKSDQLKNTKCPVQVIDVATDHQSYKPYVSGNIAVIDNFEYSMRDPELLRWKLELLEYLIGEGKIVIVITTIDPAFFIDNAADEPGFEDDAAHIELDRWARVLKRFKLYRLEGSPVAADSPFYHRVLWSSCTFSEQISLLALASHCWPNYKNNAALRHLRNRRLIAIQPEFRVLDDGFAHFVAGSVTDPQRILWRARDARGFWDWEGLRIALIVLLLGAVAAVLFFSQKDTLGIVTGAIGALTAATKVISDFRGVASGKGKAA